MIDLDAYERELIRLTESAAESAVAAGNDRSLSSWWDGHGCGVKIALATLTTMRADALPAADAPAMPPMNRTATTQAMRAAAFPRSGSLRAEIIGHLFRFPTTDDDLEHLTGRAHQSVSAARYQLAADGWVEKATHPNGTPVERRTRAGNPAQVWRLTRAALDRLGRRSTGLAV